jgi:hypothetical protein
MPHVTRFLWKQHVSTFLHWEPCELLCCLGQPVLYYFRDTLRILDLMIIMHCAHLMFWTSNSSGTIPARSKYFARLRCQYMECLQGQLEVTTLAGTGDASQSVEDVVKKVPFFMLSLDLPAARLFQDAMEKDIIPQVCHLYACSLQFSLPCLPLPPYS